MDTTKLIDEIKKALKSELDVIDISIQSNKDQEYTWTLLATILGITPVKNLSVLKNSCIHKLKGIDASIATDQNKLESAIWNILAPQTRDGFTKWLLTTGKKAKNSSKNSYPKRIEELSYFKKENYFSNDVTVSTLSDLYDETLIKQGDKGGEYYSPVSTYGTKKYYSAAAGSLKAYISSKGTPSITEESPIPDDSTEKKKEPHNIILFGPPGTGKTYNSIRYAVSIVKGIPFADLPSDQKEVKEDFDSFVDEKRIRFITFHQSLSYEDFIEGLKPVVPKKDKTKVNYEPVPGVFKDICKDARGKTDPYVLIIDEINRGNVAQIFGELITLIEEDKREGNSNSLSCTLPYSKELFSVPNNLYIIGTMNTADRSVEALDTALRRRFSFIEMLPDAQLVPKDWRPYFERINKRIEILKDSEHQIGHSYFIDIENKTDFIRVFRNNIIPLLQEYFFGDTERIRMVIGNGFFTPEKEIKKEYFPNYRGDVDIPSSIWKIWDKKKWDDCKKDPSIIDKPLKQLLDESIPESESESESEDDQS